jgi:hypothetical protein
MGFCDLAARWIAAYANLNAMESPRRKTDLQVLSAFLIAVAYPHASHWNDTPLYQVAFQKVLKLIERMEKVLVKV